MRVHEVNYDGGVPIDGYGPGFFRVGGEVIEGATLVHDGARAWGGLGDRAVLVALAEEIDVLILGMGAVIAHPPADLTAELEAVGIGVEPMASAQACRTYNVLLGEGRRVAAALLPIGDE